MRTSDFFVSRKVFDLLLQFLVVGAKSVAFIFWFIVVVNLWSKQNINLMCKAVGVFFLSCLVICVVKSFFF